MGNLPCRNSQVVRQVVRSPDDDDDEDDLVDKDVRARLDTAYDDLKNASGCQSLLKKCLTQELFDILRKRSTMYGGTLIDVIQSGIVNLDSEVGVYAPDAESYTVFSPLLEKIIEIYHGGFQPIDRHPPCNYGDPNEVTDLDQDERFILSIHISASRSIQGYPLNALLTKDQYSGIESRMFTTLGRLKGEVSGDYYPLVAMPDQIKHKLQDDGMMMEEGDRFLQGANGCREWPSGRGVFFNADRTFVVWVNQADHLRINSKRDGANLVTVYRTLVDGLSQLDKMVNFSKSSKYGFVTFNPADLGTALRVTVRARLPRMANNLRKLIDLAEKLNLRVQGTDGEQHLVQGGVVDIRNKRTLGISEINVIKEVAAGVKEVIKAEKFSD